MPNIIEHVEYLSQHIGPRPAGTEEEQQAASYIEQNLQAQDGLSVAVEDFSTRGSGDTPRCICSVVTVVFVVLALVFPVLTLPAIVLTLVSAALMFCETFAMPVLSKVFARGVSQNVVAKYEPGYSPDGASSRRRKVVVVAPYDSARVQTELSGPVLSALPLLKKIEFVSLVLVPVMILLKGVVFAHTAGAVSIIFTVVLVVLAVIVALPLVGAVVHKLAPYNDGANCNASGVAVLLDVASRVGSAHAQQLADERAGVGPTIHGEDAAYSLGVVPEGANLVYEPPVIDNPDFASQSPEERLAAAKAAVAALSGKPVNMAVHDISSHLVQVKDEPIGAPTQSQASALAAETRKAFSTLPPETANEAYANAASQTAGAEAVSSWFGDAFEAEASSSAAPAAGAAVGAAAAATSAAGAAAADVAGVVAAAAAATNAAGAAAHTGAPASAPAAPAAPHRADAGDVPDWFKKAQEKAKRPKEEAPVHRSRYADAFDAADHLGEPSEEPSHEGSLPQQTEPGSAGANLVPQVQDDSSPAAAAPNGAFAQTQGASLVEGAKPQGAANHDSALSGVPRVIDVPAVSVSVEVSEMPAGVEGAAAAAASDGASANEPGARAVDAVDAAVSVAAPGDSRQRGGFAMPSFLKERALRSKKEVEGRTTNRVEVSVDPAAYGAEGLEISDSAPVRQPITLPPIDASEALPPLAEMKKQRAPLADGGAQGISSAKRMLGSLPSIDLNDGKAHTPASSELTGKDAAARANLQGSVPSLTGGHSQGAGSSEAAGAARVGAADAWAQRAPLGEGAPADAGKTISFVPGATGSFAPVTPELLKNVDEDDIYVDDADDSGYDGVVTETGAFAGPGYVDMPKSRAHRFFGKFHFGRRKKEEEGTPQEWLQVDDQFDARSVGAARGGWESFRQDDDADLGATQAFAPYSAADVQEGAAYGESYGDDYEPAYEDSYEDSFVAENGFADDEFSGSDSAFGAYEYTEEYDYSSSDVFVDSPDDSFSDRAYADAGAEKESKRKRTSRSSGKKRSWHGGAFSRRMMKSEASAQADDVPGAEEFLDDAAASYSHESYDMPETEGYASYDGQEASMPVGGYAHDAAPDFVEDGINQVYGFRDGTINTEVWFVALGSEYAGCGGMNAFLAEHAQDLRGAIVIELEAVGAGTLSLVEREGACKQVSFSSRMKRYVRKAQGVLGETVPSVKMCWRNSAASVAAKGGLQAMHLVGAVDGKPAFFGQADDVLDNVDEETMLRNSDFVMELLKNI